MSPGFRLPRIRWRAWLQTRPTQALRARERLLDAMREVGVLLIAFAPLDAVLVESPRRRNGLLIFLALGLFLFLVAIIVEWRSASDH